MYVESENDLYGEIVDLNDDTLDRCVDQHGRMAGLGKAGGLGQVAAARPLPRPRPQRVPFPSVRALQSRLFPPQRTTTNGETKYAVDPRVTGYWNEETEQAVTTLLGFAPKHSVLQQWIASRNWYLWLTRGAGASSWRR